MDLNRHYTHWEIRDDVAQALDEVPAQGHWKWNTYFDHPPGYGLDHKSVDFWGNSGRGDPLPEHVGDAIVAWLLGQHVVKPIAWLIWWGWIWDPINGWTAYNGWQGMHKDHIHVTFV